MAAGPQCRVPVGLVAVWLGLADPAERPVCVSPCSRLLSAAPGPPFAWYSDADPHPPSRRAAMAGLRWGFRSTAAAPPRPPGTAYAHRGTDPPRRWSGAAAQGRCCSSAGRAAGGTGAKWRRSGGRFFRVPEGSKAEAEGGAEYLVGHQSRKEYPYLWAGPCPTRTSGPLSSPNSPNVSSRRSGRRVKMSH